MPTPGAYSRRLKRDLLATPLELPCCRESFTAALLRRSRDGGFVLRGPGWSGEGKAAWVTPSLDVDWTGRRGRVSEEQGKDLRHRLLRRLEVRPGEPHRGHCFRAFLKGVFVGCGYLQDPEQAYHLELTVAGLWLAKRVHRVGKVLRLPFRFFKRRKRYVAYLKGRQSVVRFLKRLECFERALEVEDIVATRNLLGTVNRQVNFETANINKQISASERQIEEIQRLLEHPEGEQIPEGLRQMAVMRVRFPQDTLDVLGKRFSPPLSKSAVNHRLRRLSTLSRRLPSR